MEEDSVRAEEVPHADPTLCCHRPTRQEPSVPANSRPNALYLVRGSCHHIKDAADDGKKKAERLIASLARSRWPVSGYCVVLPRCPMIPRPAASSPHARQMPSTRSDSVSTLR